MKVTVPAGCGAAAAGALCCTGVFGLTLIVAIGAGLPGALLHATRPAAITPKNAPFFVRIGIVSLQKDSMEINVLWANCDVRHLSK